MQAVFLNAPREIEIKQTGEPPLGPGEVMLQPGWVGICGSDVSLFCGHRQAPAYPLLIGHEMVGKIIRVGEGVANLAIGDRVILEPNYPCGICSFCRSGRGNICPNKKSPGVNIPGCLAERFVAPAEFVFRVPDEISDTDATVIEPLAVSLRALRQSRATLGDTIAVVGCGATGLLLVQATVAQGLRVLAYDKFESKLNLARRFGAVIPGDRVDAAVWHAEGVSSVFECAGVTATAEMALSAVPRGGEVILVGLASSPATFVPLRLVREGIRLQGSIIYDHPYDFKRAIALVASGALHPSEIVTERLPFQSIERALELASTGESGKILIEMPG